MERTVDTVVWQMLASVIIPGYAIHTLVAALHAGLLSVESSQALLDAFESAAPVLSTSPAVRPPTWNPLTSWSPSSVMQSSQWSGELPAMTQWANRSCQFAHICSQM